MYHLFTDGSELVRANCGGWAYILGDKSCNGYRWHTGMNQMELLAVIQGLNSIVQASQVTVHTDSNYVIANSKRRRRTPKPLVTEFHLLLDYHDVRFDKVVSGSSIEHNKAHHLAREAMFNAIRVSD